MDVFQMNSNAHRQHEESPQSKKPRLQSPDEQPVSVSTTKIIDLNDDCLVKIFLPLDLHSLFNVALASKWLRTAACTVYKRNLGKKLVEIDNCDELKPNTRLRASINRNVCATYELEEFDRIIQLGTEYLWRGIRTNGLKITLQFLRCFGPSINNLTIYYNRSHSKRYHYVEQYINEYCSETLTEITIRNKPNISTKNFVKPFTNVQTLTIWHTVLGKQLPSFPEWFPNVQNLQLYNVSVNRNFVNAHFPHLENVCFNHFMYDELSKGNSVFSFLLFNRQVKSVTIEGWTNTNLSIPITSLLHLIKDSYPLISKLTIDLSITDESFATSKDVKQLTSGNPCLEELELTRHKFTADYAFEVISKLSSLKKFKFCVPNSPELDKLKSKLDNGWKCVIGYPMATLRREN